MKILSWFVLVVLTGILSFLNNRLIRGIVILSSSTICWIISSSHCKVLSSMRLKMVCGGSPFDGALDG